MAEIDYAALFAAEEERVSQESQKTGKKSRESKEDSRVIKIVAGQNETRYIKGYFVTDKSGKYMYYPRKISSIAMIGLDNKEFGTYGFRGMDPNDYVVAEKEGERGITAEQLNKIKTFRNNYYAIRNSGKFMSVVEDKRDRGGKNYLNNMNSYVFYMYVTEASGVENFKPGIYVIQTKSAKFNEQKTDFIKTTQKNYARFSPAAVQQFMENLVDNNKPKTEIVTITYTQSGGYDFKFSSDMLDTPFQIPTEELEHVEDLDEIYISRYHVDENVLDATLAAMRIITDRIDELDAKSRVMTSTDPMVD